MPRCLGVCLCIYKHRCSGWENATAISSCSFTCTLMHPYSGPKRGVLLTFYSSIKAAICLFHRKHKGLYISPLQGKLQRGGFTLGKQQRKGFSTQALQSFSGTLWIFWHKLPFCDLLCPPRAFLRPSFCGWWIPRLLKNSSSSQKYKVCPPSI